MSFSIKQHSLLRESRRPRAYTVLFPDPASPKGVRCDLAAGMVANVAVGAGVTVRNDFDDVPIFQRPIFNATWDAASGRWTDLVAMGDEAFRWHPFRDYREVVYRCTPFWYRIVPRSETGPALVSVADSPLEGYTLAPMFRNGQDYVYRPVFELAKDSDGLPHSRSGLKPICDIGTTVVMPLARSYDARARVESVFDWFSDGLLQLVEFATWDLHSLMSGQKSTYANTGSCIPKLSASSGCLGDGLAMAWRGKENAWKNTCSFLCDILIQKHIADDGSYTTTICHLPDMQYFDGLINEHYVEIAPYFSNVVSAQFAVGGFAMKNGVFYPCAEAKEGTAPKAYAYLNSQLAEKYPIMVGVGGNTMTNMLTSATPSSPFHWEAVQRMQGRETNFGGRLILDEA